MKLTKDRSACCWNYAHPHATSQKINISSLLHGANVIEFRMLGPAQPDPLHSLAESVQPEIMPKHPQEAAAMGRHEACSPALHLPYLLQSHQICYESARGLEKDQQKAPSTGSRNLRAAAGRKYSTQGISTTH